MPEDHYVAKTYLKHFGNPEKAGGLYAYRKSGKPSFPCLPVSVCSEPDGDLNMEWLPNSPELLGEMRKPFEKRWNLAIQELEANHISNYARLTIAGYAALLMTCTPTWRRIGCNFYDAAVSDAIEHMKAVHLRNEGCPDFPLETVAKLEALGGFKVQHDPQYVKSVDTIQLLDQAWALYQQDWVLLRNFTEDLFITSDNPFSILPSDDIWEEATRFLPITPKICLSIKPSRSKAISLPRPSELLKGVFPKEGGLSLHNVSATQVRCINRVQARSAEELVFSYKEDGGIAALVKKAAKFKVVLERMNDFDQKFARDVIRVRKIT